MRHVTAAMAAYDDAEPRLDVCGETDDEAGGEDSSDCACAGADAAIRAVQNRSGKRIERTCLIVNKIRASTLNMQDERSRVRAIISP